MNPIARGDHLHWRRQIRDRSINPASDGFPAIAESLAFVRSSATCCPGNTCLKWRHLPTEAQKLLLRYFRDLGGRTYIGASAAKYSTLPSSCLKFSDVRSPSNQSKCSGLHDDGVGQPVHAGHTYNMCINSWTDRRSIWNRDYRGHIEHCKVGFSSMRP